MDKALTRGSNLDTTKQFSAPVLSGTLATFPLPLTMPVNYFSPGIVLSRNCLIILMPNQVNPG